LETFGHVDWLSVTFDADFDERLIEAYVGTFKTLGAGSHGYTRRAQSKIGAVLLADGERRQGKSLTLSSDVLEGLRTILESDGPILDFVSHHKGRASRLDLALDIVEATITPSSLWAEYQAGMARTSTRSNLALTSNERGVETFYIGSRQSDKFLRVYDKALEQKMDDKAWLRLELQCRRLVARSYVSSMVEQKSIRPFINRAITEFCDFPLSAEFREATAQDNADVPTLARKIPHFWRWMETQVIPAMASRQVEFPEENVLKTLTLLYHKHLEKRGRNLRPNDALLDSSE